MGMQPLDKGWTRMQAAPQPGNLGNASVVVPTPLGVATASFTQSSASAAVSLNLVVPAGSTAQVCLPPLHAQYRSDASVDAAADVLTVDGSNVASQLWGRLLCTVADVAAGGHVIVRSAA